MKRIAFLNCLLILELVAGGQTLPDTVSNDRRDSFFILSPVEVRAIRAGQFAPFTTTNLGKTQVQAANLGQDIPFLLNQTPSVVINSDAGTGIGYTGIRIRGSDATRINITLNGIPYNDAESQGTFFVDLPDFLSSTSSIQVQRGVGTSSNGAGAFGASINFSTNEVIRKGYVELNNSAGSFNTWKNTIKAGTGLLGGHFTADLRLSRLSSDGFIDRAASHLRSLYFSTAYIAEKSSLRFNMILGKEKTYQAWYGITEEDLKAGRRRINYAGTEKPGDPYDNETDNYRQDHYELFFDQVLGKSLHLNTALFYSKGKGYYEQYKAEEDYATYGLPYPLNGATPILTSDFIRQLWLDNSFYGGIFSLQYKSRLQQATLGGGYAKYDGLHYGELVWASNGLTGPHRYYDLTAIKTDVNLYAKDQHQFAANWYYFLDVQFRHVGYTIDGFEDHPSVVIAKRYNFLNPKAGISYYKNGWKAYASYSIANKEPNRDDFEAGINEQPKAEHLRDLELGIEKSQSRFNGSATFYYMSYRDQLVLTGKINNVGAYTRTNIPRSFRMGVELQGDTKLNSWLQVAANLSISRNQVKNFTEYIDDYDNGGQQTNSYHSAAIAFSPAVVAGITWGIRPLKNLEISLPGKYVSRQYLDNTQHEDRSLHAFFVQDLRVTYSTHGKRIREMKWIAQVNNVFNKKYEPNGYTYNYLSGGSLVVNNYYFPMAGTNLLVGLTLLL